MKFAERELEDYIWENPGSLGKLLHPSGINGHEFIKLGRQVKCRSGIIDLLFYSFTTVYVVELKAVMADTFAMGQVNRYATQLHDEISIIRIRPTGDVSCSELYDFIKEDVSIETILVAPGFDDKVSSASSSTMHLVAADKTDSGFNLCMDGICRRYTSNADLVDALKPFYDNIVKVAQQKKAFYQSRVMR